MNENANLPEEILIEIFSKLPAKAVGRCKCLSKKWRSQLSSCQFVQLHLLNCRTKQQNLLVINEEDLSIHIITDAPIVENTVSRKLDFGITWNKVLGSCNGLVLLSNRDYDLFLVNPNTLKIFELPSLSLGLEDILSSQYGLGYDSFTDDYKVLALTYDKSIHVYSVKSGAWKRFPTSHDCRSDTRMFYGGAFVNGAVHGYSFCRTTNSAKYVIDTFDLAEHVVYQIPAAPVSYGDVRFLVLEGCLCMTHTSYSSGNIELWMMKQYGLPDSWTKFTIPTNINMELPIRLPLCFIGDRETVLVTYDDALVVYNLRDGTTKVMVVDGLPAACRYGVAYVDSLVSPNPQYSN